MSPVTVAIAGGTGRLGKFVTKALLNPLWYPSEIGKVIVLTRNTTSDSSNEPKDAGAEIVRSTPVTAEELQGVDVLVNTIAGYGSTVEERNAYATAAVEAGVKVYFSPLWGTDYRLFLDDMHDFRKGVIAHETYARNIGATKTKVIGVICGYFIDAARQTASFVGMDVPNRHFEAVGDLDVKWSGTSLADIGNSVARASILAVADPSSVPGYLVISGDMVSVQDMADLVGKSTGNEITTSVIPSAEFRAKIDPHNPQHFFAFMRFERGSGKLPSQNHNDLVNPGGKYWKWKTHEEYLQETKAEWM